MCVCVCVCVLREDAENVRGGIVAWSVIIFCHRISSHTHSKTASNWWEPPGRPHEEALPRTKQRVSLSLAAGPVDVFFGATPPHRPLSELHFVLE